MRNIINDEMLYLSKNPGKETSWKGKYYSDPNACNQYITNNFDKIGQLICRSVIKACRVSSIQHELLLNNGEPGSV